MWAAGRRWRRSSSTRVPGSGPRSRRRRAARAEAALPAPKARRSAAPGLAVGFSTLYLSVLVLLAPAPVAWRGHGWNAIASPQAVAALKLTLAASLVVAVINACAGTAIAWTL